MKLLIGDGREVMVYDVGAGPIYKIVALDAPIKFNGHELLTDDAARDKIKFLLETCPCRGIKP